MTRYWFSYTFVFVIIDDASVYFVDTSFMVPMTSYVAVRLDFNLRVDRLVYVFIFIHRTTILVVYETLKYTKPSARGKPKEQFFCPSVDTVKLEYFG